MAEEVAVFEERARIARDLHDGFIQSLAGLDLRIEACKLLLQRDPARIPHELEELHEAVARGYREVRRYLTVLRTPSRDGADLWSMLERLTAEFSVREGIRVELARSTSEVTLPATATHELAQIAREALRNAVRHGRATSAVIKLGTSPSHTYLVVRDNGTGFVDRAAAIDTDGFLAPEAAPWSIRERTAALGGSLAVWTSPGRGTEISILVPSGGQGGRQSLNRRMSA